MSKPIWWNCSCTESGRIKADAFICSGVTQAEKRKKIIEESKFLGGDMEHTHLVKGLDYALLEKVRAEITIKETDDEDLEAAVDEEEEEEVK